MRKKVFVLILMLFLPSVMSGTGRVAWLGEPFGQDTIEKLLEEGFSLEEIEKIDDLSDFDVLVINNRTVSPKEREAIINFVMEGGGLLFIFDPTKKRMEDFVSEYGIEGQVDLGTLVAPIGSPKLVESVKRNASVSTKGRGRMILLGAGRQVLATTTLFFNVDRLASETLGWLCQDWHAQETRKHLEQERNERIAWGILLIIAGAVCGYYILRIRRRKKKEGNEGDKKSLKPEKIKKSEKTSHCKYCGVEVPKEEEVCTKCKNDSQAELDRLKEKKDNIKETIEVMEKKFLSGGISRQEYDALKKTWNLKLADMEEKIIDRELKMKS